MMKIMQENKYFILTMLCFLIVFINLFLLEKIDYIAKSIRKKNTLLFGIGILTTISVITMVHFFFRIELLTK